MQQRHLQYSTEKNTYVSIMEDKSKIIPQLHFHLSYEIYLTHSGPMTCLINDKVYNLKPNDMLVFAPSDIHMATIPKNTKYLSTVFNFCPDKIVDISNEVDLLLPFRASVSHFSHKVSLSDEMVKEYLNKLQKIKELLASKSKYDYVKQQLMIAEILIYINQLYDNDSTDDIPKNKTNDDLVFNVMTYINENIAQNLSLDILCSKFFLSKNVLNNHFKKKTGYTIGQYIINYRMYSARQLLDAGESVNTVSWKVGYQNTSNFIRTYKKQLGVTPGAYKAGSSELQDNLYII